MSKEEEKDTAAPLPPPPPTDFFPVGGDDLLRDNDLSHLVERFREVVQTRFGLVVDVSVQATVDHDCVEFRLCNESRATDWRVIHDTKQEWSWAYRGEDEKWTFSANSLDSVLDMIETGKRKETDEKEEEEPETEKKSKEEEYWKDQEYEVDRDPFWTPIVKTVVERVGQKGRVHYHLQQVLCEPDYVVFNVDNKWTIRAKKDGTFVGRLFDVYPDGVEGTLDEVLAWLDPESPEQRFEHSVRIKISRCRKQLEKLTDEKRAWTNAEKLATELQMTLAILHQPHWGPETNTRAVYFGLETLSATAKTKAAEPLSTLEQMVTNECLKEMTDLPTEEIVKRLGVVSRLMRDK